MSFSRKLFQMGAMNTSKVMRPCYMTHIPRRGCSTQSELRKVIRAVGTTSTELLKTHESGIKRLLVAQTKRIESEAMANRAISLGGGFICFGIGTLILSYAIYDTHKGRFIWEYTSYEGPRY